ncbi:hypothetical protein RUM43_008985 [Polyplax serrata]|uniref:Ig-like domain-containing protein n=1 Tax=Polyplax serrata TaxID=468196 RepID=A0AAN8S1Q8_POLSC
MTNAEFISSARAVSVLLSCMCDTLKKPLPESNLKFWHTVDPDNREDNSVESDYSRDENLVNVTCVAEGVYPEPIIRIFSASRPISDKTHMRFNLRNGLYDVTASIQVDDDDMDPDEHVFECELSIPETNYTVKEALYVSLGVFYFVESDGFECLTYFSFV